MPLKVVLISPPISNLNTIYSAVPRLAGWLRKLGHEVVQVDLSLEHFLAMFNRAGLARLFDAVDERKILGELEDVYHNRDRYLCVIEDVIACLQARDLTTINRICRPDYLPEGPAFRTETPATRNAKFGPFGKGDLARNLSTLMIEDLVALFRQTISPHYELLRYAEKLALSSASFDQIAAWLASPPCEIEALMLEVADANIPEDVDLACFTCPFPGMLVPALRIGEWMASHRPNARRALGGGFPSTELRRLEDPRVFDFVDYVVLDDGEVPLQQICERIEGEPAPLSRTFVREAGKVVFCDSECASPRFRDFPPPDYAGVRMERYVHLLFTNANPMNRLLNEGTWLKVTAAHGCYWKKCTFCDIHLPYIGDFDPLPAANLADQMDALHAQTGVSSFHLTDEAAPAPLLVNLALELLRRGRTYQFWGNIRYDTGFTPDRCRLLAAAGMIAVTGGIEIASDALLPAISKGITVPQVIKVLQAFAEADILTHAYLIYGFPGETRQDTMNSLETLRQMVAARILRSAYYHVFSLTAHSPVGRDPELYGIRVKGPAFGGFAHYDFQYEVVREGQVRAVREIYAKLQRALECYCHGKGLDQDPRATFGLEELPPPTVSPTLVVDQLAAPHPAKSRAEPRLCWLGGIPRWSKGLLNVSCADGGIYSATAPKLVADGLLRCHPAGWVDAKPPRLGEFPATEWVDRLRARGIVFV